MLGLLWIGGGLLKPVAWTQIDRTKPVSVSLVQGNIPQDEKFQPGTGVPQALAPLIGAAHDREMSVVLWTAGPREAPVSPSAELLTDIDVHIPVRADRLSQSSTLYRLGWLALVDALDLQLLGETE